ncbi:hypothetical protein ACTGJ9_022765 [Bradyrhizobium sp. RDM12]
MTEEEVATAEAETMPFAEFLQSIPPGQSRRVTDFGTPGFSKQGKGLELYMHLKPPSLELHCEQCGGLRNFRAEDGDTQLRDAASLYLKYLCSNCRWFQKNLLNPSTRPTGTSQC